MSTQYRISGTDVYLSHEAVESCILKAVYSFRRKNEWLLSFVDEPDLIQHGWMRVLMKLAEGFSPDYPETYLYRVVYTQLMAIRNVNIYKNRHEWADCTLNEQTKVLDPTTTTVDNVEDAFLTKEISLAADRVIARLAGEYPKCAIGAQIVREEMMGVERKDVIHELTQQGHNRRYLWSCRRTFLTMVREELLQ
jgi:hypothetical protein